jgi:hypothetical protein
MIIRLQRIGNSTLWCFLLRALAVGALLYTAYITFRYIQQPLVDVHPFRQTQTALTAYWMREEGWSLSYETPVVGFPWSIPFEFPIYQALVAALSGFFSLDLVATGRFVSFLFLVACAWPAFSVSRRLKLPESVPWVFCALLWTSPLYVYWGRTFMIETAALFFSFAAIPYAIDLVNRVGGWRSAALFVVFASAGVLQKSTTAGPILLFLLFAAVFFHIRQFGMGFSMLRRLVRPIAIIIIPLIIGLVWAHYTDIVKIKNPVGNRLTSKALMSWNFGTLAQRLNPETWKVVVWKRSLKPNAGGILGVFLLLLPWVSGQDQRRFAWLVLATIVLFLLPLMIFTNLHYIHEYYQAGCVLFLIFALSVSIGGWLKAATGIMVVVPFVTLVFMFLNIMAFHSGYGIVAARSLAKQDPLSVKRYKIGLYLRDHTSPDEGLVIFGGDWSSEISFHSQRKSMTVPHWFKDYHQVWENPQKYLDGLALGAIVVCPSNAGPTDAEIDERLSKENNWRLEKVDDCKILLRNFS